MSSYRMSLRLNPAEFDYLYRLLGNHIHGQGPYREINYDIFNRMWDHIESQGGCPLSECAPLVGTEEDRPSLTLGDKA